MLEKILKFERNLFIFIMLFIVGLACLYVIVSGGDGYYEYDMKFRGLDAALVIENKINLNADNIITIQLIEIVNPRLFCFNTTLIYKTYTHTELFFKLTLILFTTLNLLFMVLYPFIILIKKAYKIIEKNVIKKIEKNIRKEIKDLINLQIITSLVIFIYFIIVFCLGYMAITKDMLRIFDVSYKDTIGDVVCNLDPDNSNNLIVEFYDKNDHYELIETKGVDITKTTIFIYLLGLLFVNTVYFAIELIIYCKNIKKEIKYKISQNDDFYNNFIAPDYSIVLRIALMLNTTDPKIIKEQINEYINSDNLIYKNENEDRLLKQLMKFDEKGNGFGSYELNADFMEDIKYELIDEDLIKERTFIHSLIDFCDGLRLRGDNYVKKAIKSFSILFISCGILSKLEKEMMEIVMFLGIALITVYVICSFIFLPLTKRGREDKEKMLVYDELYKKKKLKNKENDKF